ncbi:MAG: hypothetical protein KF768_11280 [Phycisphaeraceae bacterium]|nr:hypothetical protein [Phycisphaeraceae bacterium]
MITTVFRRTRRPILMLGVAIALVACVPAISGCGVTGRAENPAFPITADEAKDELRTMRANPVRPARPVVVIGGLFDVGIVADDLADRIRRHTSPSADVIVVSPFGTSTVEESRRKVVARLEERFPSDHADTTVEVDVVGFSLGGVIASYAALEPEERAAAVDPSEAEGARSMKRLNVVRLFAISVPYSGSDAASPPTLDSRVAAIRRGSPVLKAISDERAASRGLTLLSANNPHTGAPADASGTGGHSMAGSQRGYVLIPYARLQDNIVGPESAAPPGEHPFWVSNLPLELAHAHAYKDPRILADICRRLRNEPAYTRFPAGPVPGSDGAQPSAEPAQTPSAPARDRAQPGRSTGTWGN